MKIAVIPARGGSKRITRKNLREFYGRPILSYAIELAINSGMFAHVVVSTEDTEIARVARDCGAEVPFQRPQMLADDFTTTVSVIANAVHACDSLGWRADFVCCIYPTAVFSMPEDLENAFKLLVKSGADYCFPIAQFPSPVQRALKKSITGELQPIDASSELCRTQDLEPAYYDAGQFYWGRRDSWVKAKPIHSNAVGYVIQSWRAVDIDSEEDWNQAEIVYEVLRLRNKPPHRRM